MFFKGDVVAIPLEYIFYNFFEERENLRYQPRSLVYGVVSLANNRDRYIIKWGIEGLFNISDGECETLEDQFYSDYQLSLIRAKDDDDDEGDPYLQIFFRHNGRRWKIRRPNLTCDYSTCSGNCGISTRVYRMPMLQLYIDLHLEENNHLSNRQKRYISYRWYTRIRHGVLTTGDRRACCQCVVKEIENLFPRPAGE